MTDNQNWQYRTSLEHLKILSREGENEVWQETTNGITILFKTREKRPFEYYAFDISSQFFTGEWNVQLTPIHKYQTRFVATESLTFPNPFIRVLSYLFMDLEKFMQTYEDELRTKLEKE
ncbi:polyketide cyclase [Rodentibacter caecimuris]|uniref:Polyketide cyclase n=1 Tax=Rodentibacter caecimuris TaxID=1796644 RepID=A0ABX3KZ67_9PAST|nr:polyketide cyclase [Rodentibacter heylii]